MQPSMSLKYEPSSEPLHISVKQLTARVEVGGDAVIAGLHVVLEVLSCTLNLLYSRYRS